MINQVWLSGRLTTDAKVGYSVGQKKYAVFTLAVNRNKDQADFVDCVVWEKTADVVEKYTSKGSKINLTGRLSTRTRDRQDGIKVKVVEVVGFQVELLDSKPKEETRPTYQPDYIPEDEPFGNPLQFDDSDLPF